MFTGGLRRPWRISFPKLRCYCWRQRVVFTRGRANANCRNTHPSTGMLLILLGHGGTDRQQAETITAWGRDELPCWRSLEASLAPQPSPDRPGGGQRWGRAQLVINKHSARTGHLLPSLQQNHTRSREMQPLTWTKASSSSTQHPASPGWWCHPRQYSNSSTSAPT